MAFPAARVAGTSIFLTATFDAPAAETQLIDRPEITPILDEGRARRFGLIATKKSRGVAAAAA